MQKLHCKIERVLRVVLKAMGLDFCDKDGQKCNTKHVSDDFHKQYSNISNRIFVLVLYVSIITT